MKRIKLTPEQSEVLIRQVKACVIRSKRYCERHSTHDFYYPHLVGGLQGVLEQIEPKLFEVFRTMTPIIGGKRDGQGESGKDADLAGE